MKRRLGAIGIERSGDQHLAQIAFAGQFEVWDSTHARQNMIVGEDGTLNVIDNNIAVNPGRGMVGNDSYGGYHDIVMIRDDKVVVGDPSPARAIPVVIAGPVGLTNYSLLALPDPSLYEGAEVYVSDAPGGKCIAYSDGNNWRRVRDDVILY